MVGSLLLALIAALPILPGDPPSRSWLQRVIVLSDGAHECELERLVVEMREEARSTSAPAEDLADALAYATASLLQARPESLCITPDLTARLAEAREAARRFGDEDERLHVENEYARVLLSEQRTSEARQVLENAREVHRDARQRQPELLEILYDLALQDCRWDAADELSEETLSRLDDLEQAVAPTSPWSWTYFEVRARILALRVAYLVDLGMPDRAALDLEKLEALSARALEGFPGSAAPILEVKSKVLFAYACLDVASMRRTLEGVLAEPEKLDPYDVPQLEYLLAIACLELSRDGERELADKARSILSRLLDDRGSSPHLARAVSIALADLALRAGEYDVARERIEFVETSLREGGTDVTRCSAMPITARLAALRSNLARRTDVPAPALAHARDELVRESDAFLERQAGLPIRPGGTGSLAFGEQRGLIAELIEIELAIDPTSRGIERGIEAVLRSQRLGTTVRRLGLPAVGLAEVRERLLGEGIGLCLWLTSIDGSHLFLVDRHAVHHVPLARNDLLLAAARAFSEVVQAPPPPRSDTPERLRRERELLRTGQALGDLLLPREARELLRAWRGFYTCGLELIESPPIEALPWHDGQLLGTALAISGLPSLSQACAEVSARASRDRGPTDFDAVVVCAPEHGPDARARWPELAPIEPSGSDLASLRSGFGRDRVRVLTGTEANLETIATDARRCSLLLEIFSHGVRVEGEERPSAIVVTSDAGSPGLLDCRWIESRLDPPPIVALYACGSGRGPSRIGDDTAAQLGSALQFRNASLVLLSRAKVAHGASIELSREFRAALLREGAAPAEALRVARASLARSERWNDPFYFATLTMFGAGLSDLPALTALRSQDIEDLAPSRARLLVALGSIGAVVILGIALARRGRRSVRGTGANAGSV